jgi:TatD DNase family protein
MELVDIQDLKSWGSNAVPVQLRPRVNQDAREPGTDQARSHNDTTLIDSHCHLDMVVERGIGVEEISNCLRDNNVSALVEIGADKAAMQWARTLAHTSKFIDVYYTIGHHPGEAGTEDSEYGLSFIEENAADPLFVAVGEIGLDYHYHADQAEAQKTVFREYIRAARRVNRGIAIHTRDAHADTFAILREEAADMPILIHCFTGTKSEMEDFLTLGAYVSFSGIVTFKNAKGVQEAALACPRDRILVETDAPFLAPIPFRGKINQPGYVRQTLDFLARLRGDESAELAKSTVANTRAFYRIG